MRSARILPGNASESKTLQKALEQLSSTRVSVIMDAGIATRANLVFLKEIIYLAMQPVAMVRIYMVDQI